MKKSYIILSVTLAALFIIVSTTNVTSNLVSPPAGSTGDPLTGATCSQNTCHSGQPVQSTSSDLTFNIGTGSPTTTLDANFKYTPNTTYNIAFLVATSSATNPYYGFQVSCLDATTHSAGTFVVSNSQNTKITTLLTGANQRQYIGHLGASSFHNWSFKWTSPACATGPVTFYYTFNQADASTTPPSQPEGTIHIGSVTIQADCTTGIADISDKLSDLNIFPNPVSNQFGMSFNMKATDEVSASVYTLDGKLATQLLNEKVSTGSFNRAFNINDLATGIYLVKLNVGDVSVTQKIVKQ